MWYDTTNLNIGPCLHNIPTNEVWWSLNRRQEESARQLRFGYAASCHPRPKPARIPHGRLSAPLWSQALVATLPCVRPWTLPWSVVTGQCQWHRLPNPPSPRWVAAARPPYRYCISTIYRWNLRYLWCFNEGASTQNLTVWPVQESKHVVFLFPFWASKLLKHKN